MQSYREPLSSGNDKAPPESTAINKQVSSRRFGMPLFLGFGACLIALLIAARFVPDQQLTQLLAVLRPEVQFAKTPAGTASHLGSDFIPTTILSEPDAENMKEPTSTTQEAAEKTNEAKPKESPVELFKRVSPAVVRVSAISNDASKNAQGSGFFLTDDGVVVTNYHVISDADSIDVVLECNARFGVTGILGISKDDDIALLKVDAANVPALSLLDLEGSNIGDPVYAIGNPAGLVNTFSQGFVSGKRMVNKNLSVIQYTAAISPGSSGGPLLDRHGNVLGITTFYYAKGQNLNFAIPCTQIRSLIAKSSTLMSIEEAFQRPKPIPKQIVSPRWARDLPHEARIQFRISAGPQIKGQLDGFFNRELRKITGVVITDDHPQWDFSVVALPEEYGNTLVGYDISVVVLEIDEYFDPDRPYETATRGHVVSHQLMTRGINNIEEGIRNFVATFESEVIGEDRKLYDGLREYAKHTRERVAASQPTIQP